MFHFPPHLTSVFALPGKTDNMKVMQNRTISLKCCTTNTQTLPYHLFTGKPPLIQKTAAGLGMHRTD